jgi:hypothetical protein
MAQISAAKGALKLDQLAMRIGSSTVRGQVALGTAGAKRHVEARIEVDELILGKLLATLLDNRLAIAGTAESALSGRQSTWPDEPFDAAPFAGFEGNLHLASKHLTIADGVGLGQTTIDVAFEQGKVEVKRLEGDGLGGRCIATISVEKVPAGAEVAGTVQISGAKLEALTKAESKAASGTMNAEVKFAGKGTSPRSAISSLKGAGVVEFANGKLSALWPGAVRMGIEAAFKAEPNKMNSTFRDTLIAGLSANPVQLPARLPVEIEDGQLRVKPFAIDAAEGRSLGGASLDLRTLTFQSDWRIEQKAVGDAAADRALPPISVSYGGMATALGSLEPRFDLDALERELSVRRMERDVEELERLRKLDEARRRSEIERLRQQLERSQPPVVPGAPAGTPGLARPAAPG